MSALSALKRPLDKRSFLIGSPVRVVAAITMLAMFVGVFVSGGNATFARLVLAGATGAVFIVMAGSNRNLALGTLVIWLVLLGFIRRFLIPFAGWSENDPLTLVGPAAALIFLLLAPRDDVPERDPLTPFIVMLFLWCIAEVVNPLQGSVVVGVKGLLFWLGPLLWFFVGKRLHGHGEALVRKVALWGCLPVLALGFYHSFIGFLPFELHWVGVGGIGAAVFIDGFKIRPFSTLGSPQEYGFFLVFAAAIVWPRVLKSGPHRKAWALLFFLVWLALLFQSTRTLMVLFFVMMIVTSMLWYRSAAVTFVLSGFLVLLMMLGSLGISEVNLGEGPPWSFANHTINGLLNPNDSTLPLHKKLVRDAIHLGIKEPLGVGVGQASVAAVKEGRAYVSAENDMATSVAALGFPAGILYIVFILTTFFVAIRRFLRTRAAFDLGTIGVLIVFLTQWWANNMYCAHTLFWLTVGGLAASEARELPWDSIIPVRKTSLPLAPVGESEPS